jgi:hypothetical protein
MEHVNQVIGAYLCTFTSWWQDDWDNLLPSGNFHYNNSKHSLTQQTPFMVDTRRNTGMGFEPQQPHSNLESVNDSQSILCQTVHRQESAGNLYMRYL